MTTDVDKNAGNLRTNGCEGRAEALSGAQLAVLKLQLPVGPRSR